MKTLSIDIEIFSDVQLPKVVYDDVVATIMDLNQTIRCGNDLVVSIYDFRGILFI